MKGVVMPPSFLFIGKKHDFFCEQAETFVRLLCPETTVLLGTRGKQFPEELHWWSGDYIISYLSPWIIPAFLLDRASIAAINFHPGPPEYPGVGCTNFAIYNNESIFGITCHHMAPKVDTGEIIAVRRFPVFEADTVFSLTQRCYSFILTLFYEVISDILRGLPLPSAPETWQRLPYTRSELNNLCEIKVDMDREEVQRRIKATTFPKAPGAFVNIQGKIFYFDADLEIGVPRFSVMSDSSKNE